MKRSVVVLVISLALVAGCSNDKDAAAAAAASVKQPEAVSIRTVAAVARTVDRTLSVTGTLQPDETVSVSFEVAGRVRSISVDFGQDVAKGAVIAELDSQEYRLQLARAQAALAQALARLGLTLEQKDVVPTTTPAIRQAEAQSSDAKSKSESAQKLFKTGDVARERYEELDKAYQARQANVDAARDEMRVGIASAQALKADVSIIQKRVSDSVVRAPWSGTVSERLVSPGQYIKENSPVVTLIKTDVLRLRFDVPESATANVRVGSTMTFTTDAVPGVSFNAVVKELNPTLDTRSRTLSAEARISRADKRLRPGIFAQVQLVTERNVNITAVPKKAIFSLAGLTKVFAIRNGKAVEYKIPPGLELGDWVEVPGADIKPGDTVAISNLEALVDDQPVKVI